MFAIVVTNKKLPTWRGGIAIVVVLLSGFLVPATIPAHGAAVGLNDWIIVNLSLVLCFALSCFAVVAKRMPDIIAGVVALLLTGYLGFCFIGAIN